MILRPIRLAATLAGLSIGLTAGSAAPAMAQGTEPAPAFTREQTRAIERIVRDYLLKNPEILPEVVQALESKMARNAIAANRDALFNDANSVSIGNPKADVTIVEFFDYTCGYCQVMAPRLQKLVAADSNLRLVFKEFPIRSPVATFASKAAIAARKQGRYVEFHNALYAKGGVLTEASILEKAKSVGLDVNRLKKDMESPEVEAIIEANHSLGNALSIRGTPAFIINNQMVPGAVSEEELVAQIKTARAEAQKTRK